MQRKVSSSACDTRYPVVLVGGKLTNSPGGLLERQIVVDPNHRFSRLEETLIDCGADVHVVDLAMSDCDSISTCAADLKTSFLQFKAVSGSSKLNMIGLLDGGLASRHAITKLGLAQYVSSLTTINSPHRGSALFDLLSEELFDSGYAFLPYLEGLQTFNMTNIFAPNTPNMSGIYYQSYASSATLEDDDGYIVNDIVEAVAQGEFLLATDKTAPDEGNDGSGSSGKRSGSSSKRSGSSGKHSGSSGKHTGSSGKHSDSSGKQSGLSGKHSGSSGKHSGSSGRHSGSLGKHSASSGKHSGSSDSDDKQELLEMCAKLISEEEQENGKGLLNDGISSVVSQKWGNYRGNLVDYFSDFVSPSLYAFDAIDEFGMASWNVQDFYEELVTDLKDRGF
eukprot:scaffold2142_cov165-Amphora_coffeaeformis.AAC.7